MLITVIVEWLMIMIEYIIWIYNYYGDFNQFSSLWSLRTAFSSLLIIIAIRLSSYKGFCFGWNAGNHRLLRLIADF